MHDERGHNNNAAPSWAISLSTSPQDAPMTKENKLVLLGLVLVCAALLSLCL